VLSRFDGVFHSAAEIIFDTRRGQRAGCRCAA
jgi:hypothetical protein